MRYSRLIVLILAALILLAGELLSQDNSPIVSARIAAAPDRLAPGSRFELVVTAAIRPGYHIGAADKDALYPASITVRGSKGIRFDKPIFPRAERKTFEFSNKPIPVYEGTFQIRIKGRIPRSATPGEAQITAVLSTQACKGDQCYPPEEAEVRTKIHVLDGPAAPVADSSQPPVPDEETAATGLEGSRGIKRLLLIYFGGLLLAFTPCVYPMIPVTVGYFSGQSQQRKGRVIYLAAAYVLGLALTYAVLGTVAATTGSAIGSALQSPWVLLGIAVVLVVLALSMFGLYELRAPAFIQSRASGKSGVLGALIMGLIFGIVAAPCTGPFVLGLTLLAAKTADPLAGFIMFFVLALGLGTPLFLLAAFSARLPVPGSWMLAVERLGGFVLLGAAAYFIGPILPEALRPYPIPAVVLAAGIYLGYFNRSVKSSKRSAFLGKMLFVAAVAVVAYMIWPASERPSMEWREYRPGAIAEVAASGRASMVYFSAKWCVACGELDKIVWKNPEVVNAAKELAKFRVDGTRSTPQVRAAEKELGVAGMGYPITLFFDSNGREVKSARVVGFVKPKEMIRRIKMTR